MWTEADLSGGYRFFYTDEPNKKMKLENRNSEDENWTNIISVTKNKLEGLDKGVQRMRS